MLCVVSVCVCVCVCVCVYATVCIIGMKCSCHSSQCSPCARRGKGSVRCQQGAPLSLREGGGRARTETKAVTRQWQNWSVYLVAAREGAAQVHQEILGGASCEPLPPAPNAAFSLFILLILVSISWIPILCQALCLLCLIQSVLTATPSSPFTAEGLSPCCGALQCCWNLQAQS